MKRALILLVILFLVSPVFATENLELPPAGTTPDSTFYFMDRLGENLRLAFTFNKQKRAELAFQFSQERLSEALEMVNQYKFQYVESLMTKYQEMYNQSIEGMENAKTRGKNMASLQIRIMQSTNNQLQVMQEIYESSSVRISSTITYEQIQNNQEQIQNAMKNCLQKYEQINNYDRNLAERLNIVLNVPEELLETTEEETIGQEECDQCTVDASECLSDSSYVICEEISDTCTRFVEHSCENGLFCTNVPRVYEGVLVTDEGLDRNWSETIVSCISMPEDIGDFGWISDSGEPEEKIDFLFLGLNIAESELIDAIDKMLLLKLYPFSNDVEQYEYNLKYVSQIPYEFLECGGTIAGTSYWMFECNSERIAELYEKFEYDTTIVIGNLQNTYRENENIIYLSLANLEERLNYYLNREDMNEVTEQEETIGQEECDQCVIGSIRCYDSNYLIGSNYFICEEINDTCTRFVEHSYEDNEAMLELCLGISEPDLDEEEFDQCDQCVIDASVCLSDSSYVICEEINDTCTRFVEHSCSDGLFCTEIPIEYEGTLITLHNLGIEINWSETKVSCISMPEDIGDFGWINNQGDPEEKIDFLFLGLNLSESELIDAIDKMLFEGNWEYDSPLFKLKPFSDYEDKFNIKYVYDIPYEFLECGHDIWVSEFDRISTFSGGISHFTCNYERIELLYGQYGYDVATVVGDIVKGSRVGGNTIFMQLPFDNYSRFGSTFSHELGHVFGLEEEYIKGSFAIPIEGGGSFRVKAADCRDYSHPFETIEECISDREEDIVQIPNLDVIGCPKWCESYDLTELLDENMRLCGHIDNEEECYVSHNFGGRCSWLGEEHPVLGTKCIIVEPINSLTHELIDIGINCLEDSGCYLGGNFYPVSYISAHNSIMIDLFGNFSYGAREHLRQVLDCCFPKKDTEECIAFRNKFKNMEEVDSMLADDLAKIYDCSW